MKCDKCGTPIITGETTCRICGNKTDFSKRERKVEVIDFPEEFETIENNVEPSNLKINEQKEEPIDLPDLDKVEEKKEETVDLPDLEEIISSTSTNLKLKEIEEPKKTTTSKKIKPEIIEEDKPTKKSALDKVGEEKPKKVKKEKSNGKISSTIGIILLTLILLCSLGLNVYLFVMDGNREAKGNNKPIDNETVYSKVSYKDYKLTMPATWITENQDKNLLIYDENQTWAANMQIVDKANYNDFVTNKDTFVESLASLKYQFTSNYSKKAQNEDKEYYLFKGKYYNYSVYVIVNALNDNELLVTDLKFKGEVDDILLNNLLTVCGSIKDKDTKELFKENFEFNDLNEKVSSVSQKEE